MSSAVSKQMQAPVEKVTLNAPEDRGITTKWGDTIYGVNFIVMTPKTADTVNFSVAAK